MISLFSKNVVFTRFLPKMREGELPPLWLLRYVTLNFSNFNTVSHHKNISLNQLFSKYLVTVTFTKKNASWENSRNFHTVHFTLWKSEKLSLTEKIFREINSLNFISALVNPLISRNFCQKCKVEGKGNSPSLKIYFFVKSNQASLLPHCHNVLAKFPSNQLFTTEVYL